MSERTRWAPITLRAASDEKAENMSEKPQKHLVRSSDRPPIDPQADLLRAARQGQETPAEELLRAGPGSGQDV